ncbi:hypothetical protein [Paenibacillus pini]|uniref:Uncharacterized protein n=1 Tax=Paenibacillus pini JCM 16418 TaxID=1236976 RepID=W7YNM2_9BACL|nr:hypothetical protein [Paenibacillus pini]GAF09208.1 hypothetical protein JCM16418_3328 [Paenibacillus pini JCM 16418]
MKKKTWIILSVCSTLAIGGFIWGNFNANQVDANSPTLQERVSYAAESYDAQKKIADAPGATTADEQKLKELASKAGDLEAKLSPKSTLDEFNEVFAGYKDLYEIESAYYADQQDSKDPSVQRVLEELDHKGKLIATFENKAQSQALSKSTNDQSLLDQFMEATSKLNQELYPEQYK